LKQRLAQLQPHEVELGCPLNNLGQEMSPLDERFRRRVAATFETWTEGFAQVLRHGQTEGSVRKDLDSRKLATFLVAAIEGSFGLAKSAQSPAILHSNLEVLGTLLECLRPSDRMRKKTRRRSRRNP